MWRAALADNFPKIRRIAKPLINLIRSNAVKWNLRKNLAQIDDLLAHLCSS
jgi:hypothetical protein